MLGWKFVRGVVTGSLVLMTLSIALVGCTDWVNITFDNRTNKELLVEVNDGGVEQVQARSARTISYLAKGVERFEITVKTSDGNALFHDVFTEEELARMGNRIIIEEPSSRRPIVPRATAGRQRAA